MFPERLCVVTACRREVMRSEHCVYSRCEFHVRALLTGAFSDSELESRRVESLHPRASASRLQLAAEGRPGRCVLRRTG
jgi:hypothetical protein